MRLSQTVVLALAATPLLFSCTKEKPLHQRISVTAADGSALSEVVYIPLEGASSFWNVQSDEAIDIFYKEAAVETSSWFHITEVSQTAAGEYKISYTAQPRGNTLEKRSGTLSLVSPEHYLGAFLSVRQGYDKVWGHAFSGGEMSLLPGSSWTSGTMDGISAVKEAWLAFSARADELPGGGAATFPLEVTLTGGGYFKDINRTSYQVDIQTASQFGADNFYKLHIFNDGKVFSSESRIIFSVPAEKSSVIRLRDVSLYEIPVKGSGITGISDSDE